MNEKEIAEIRRRFRADKSNITHVRGCYVNEKKEIVSSFYQPVALLPQAESEALLTILKKTLTGTLGKNLVDISFATQQVVDGPEHKLLMGLRANALRDSAGVDALFQQIIQALDMEGNYLILLTCDAYDVPYRGKDGEDFDDGATEVYTYILCSVCPVKMTKPALSFAVHDNAFHNLSPDWVIAPPELGFLFPAFDERSTNLYGALYYTRDEKNNHPQFAKAVFNAPLLMPAAAQRDTFHTILEESLAEDCRYQVVQAVNDQLRELIAEHKESKVREPLTISGGAMGQMLTHCGVTEERADDFAQRYSDAFGPDTRLSPRNLADTRQLEIAAGEVKIQVSAQRGDLVQTRLIDGERYILIRAEDMVTVNGVPINF